MEDKELVKIYQSALIIASLILLLGCKEAETEEYEPNLQEQRSDQQVSPDQTTRVIALKPKTENKAPIAKATLMSLTKKNSIPDQKSKLPEKKQTSNRSETTVKTPLFVDNSDGTVTDDNTGLMWQRQDDNKIRSWFNADKYCGDTLNDGSGPGGWNDWRLPDKKELVSIVKSKTSNPAIDHKAFPGTNSSTYWSSATSPFNTSLAWGVYFGSGYVNKSYKTNKYYVRCVRSE